MFVLILLVFKPCLAFVVSSKLLIKMICFSQEYCWSCICPFKLAASYVHVGWNLNMHYTRYAKVLLVFLFKVTDLNILIRSLQGVGRDNWTLINIGCLLGSSIYWFLPYAWGIWDILCQVLSKPMTFLTKKCLRTQFYCTRGNRKKILYVLCNLEW